MFPDTMPDAPATGSQTTGTFMLLVCPPVEAPRIREVFDVVPDVASPLGILADVLPFAVVVGVPEQANRAVARHEREEIACLGDRRPIRVRVLPRAPCRLGAVSARCGPIQVVRRSATDHRSPHRCDRPLNPSAHSYRRVSRPANRSTVSTVAPDRGLRPRKYG